MWCIYYHKGHASKYLGDLINRVSFFKDMTTLELVKQPGNFLIKVIMITPVVINECKHILR